MFLRRRARHLSILRLLGAVGAAGGFVACGNGGGTGTAGHEPVGAPTSLTSQTAPYTVVSSTSGSAPATPFTESGGALRSVNIVRSVAMSGDTVVGRWSGRVGPDTRTARVLLGGAAVTLPSQWAIEGSGVVRSAGGVIERIAPTSVGYRRSWTFASGPSRGGSILASIATSADAVLSLDSSGLHVVRDGSRFRIGSATWIDATGAQATIAPSYENGQLVYEVPASLVQRSAFPAVLDPDVGPEFLVPPTENINPWLFTNDTSLQATQAFPLDNGGVGVIVYATGNYWGSSYLLDIFAPSASSPTGLTLTTSKGFPGIPPFPTGTGSGSGGGTTTSGASIGPVPASAACGSDECLAWPYLSSGNVYVERFDLTAWQPYETAGVLVTNSVTDSPVTGSVPTITTNGSAYLVCWLDSGSGTGDVVHCTTRALSNLAAVGSTAQITGTIAASSYSTAATQGAFAVLLPGATVDAGVIDAPVLSVIDSATGAVAGTPALPASLGAAPGVVGEAVSGGGFLLSSLDGAAQVPSIYFYSDAGIDAGAYYDASIAAPGANYIQRVTAAGALSGAPFTASSSFGVDVVPTLCTGQMFYGSTGLDGGALLAVPGRGTLGYSSAAGSSYNLYGGGPFAPNAAFCDQFGGTAPFALQAASGPLAAGGFVRADPNPTGLCSALDASAFGDAAYHGICYDTVGGGLGAFVPPTPYDAGTGPSGMYRIQSFYEIATGATSATTHDEISGSLPSALAAIQNGYVSSASGKTAYTCGLGGCGYVTTATSLQSTLYDAGSGQYGPSGPAMPLYSYADRRTALHGSYDSTSETYFVGWFQEGTTPLPEAGSGPLPDGSLYVSLYADPGGAADAGTTAKAAPLAIMPLGAGASFAPAPSTYYGYSSYGSGSLDFEPLWSMDAALQTALVSFLETKSNGTAVLIGQLVSSNGTLKGSAGGLSTVSGVTGLRTCHSLTDYFVSYLTSSGWSTVEVDPTQSSLTPVAEPAGSPVPFANAVGNVMPAYLSVTSGSSTVTHVGLVSVSSPTTVVKDFDVDIASWSPPQAGFASGGSGGGYYGNLDVYSGTDDVIVTYPVQSSSSTTTYCARIDATSGAYIDSHPCTPPIDSSGSCVGSFCSFGGAGAPGVGDAAEKLLSINTGATPPTVQRWFVEPWATGETPDLPFPAPTRPFAADFATTDGGAALFSWDTSAQTTIVGGGANALALYFGIWTQPDGLIERDLYARWIRPGFVGTQTCASNDECDSNQCVSSQCVAVAPPPLPDAGSGSSSGASSGGAADAGGTGSGGGTSSGSGTDSGTGSSGGGATSGGSTSSGAASDSGTGSSGGGTSSGAGDAEATSSSGGASSSGAATSSGAASSSGTGVDASATENDSGSPGSSGSSGASEEDGGGLAFDGGPTVMPSGSSGSKGGCGCLTVGTEGHGSRGDAGALLGVAVAAALARRRRR
jgi:hypothetical protein